MTANELGNVLPLSGVRVIDLTTTIAGPSATRLLADFGAEVIKVESETHLDTSRLSSPYANGVQGVNSSGYFSAYNAGKRSISLNLSSDAAIEVLALLVAASDVLVESFAPGVMERRGLTDERLRSWNPSLIIAHHSLQGQTGPRSRQRGYGQLASAMTGWFDITGESGQDPVGPYSAFTDFVAWPILAASVVLALEERDLRGIAATIDHSHVESSAYFAAPELVSAQLGSPPLRDGNAESYAWPSDTFPCAGEDQWCAITVADEGCWLALCTVLGDEQLSADPRYHSLAGRLAHREELGRAISSLTSKIQSRELESRLREAGISAGRVYRAQDLFVDDQLAFRRVFRQVDHPVLGSHAVVSPAYSLSGVESGPVKGFPLLGADTEHICTEILQLSAEVLASFAERGAFE